MTLHEALDELREWIEAAKQQDPGAILCTGCKVSTALPALETVVAELTYVRQRPLQMRAVNVPAAGTLAEWFGYLDDAPGGKS